MRKDKMLGPWAEVCVISDFNEPKLLHLLIHSACTLSHSRCVRLFPTPWTVARQAPLSMGFSRQEHWCGLPCPLPGVLPDPGIERTCLLCWQTDSLPIVPPRKVFNSLTGDVWFSLFNGNIFDILMTWSLLQKPPYILAPPLPLWSNLRACLPALSPQQVCQIKHNFQVLDCTFFLFI